MKFSYTAKTPQGEIQVGMVDAGSRETALATIQGYGLIVLRLDAMEKGGFFQSLLAGFKHVSMQELSVFTRQLSTLLGAEIPIVESLRTMFQQIKNVYLKEALFDVVSDVEAGAPLSQAFSRHPGIFANFYVQMVKSAEVTGRLQEVFDYLAEYYEAQAQTISRVKSAMMYPIFIFALFGVVVLIMITVVVPRLASFFAEAGITLEELPFFTRILFGLKDYLRTYWQTMVIFAAAFILILRAYLRTDEGRDIMGSIFLKFPIVGSLSRKLYLSRFCQTASVMIKGDIPVAQSLDIAAEVVGNLRYGEIIRDAAEGVRRGELISEALSHYPEDFPPMVTQMIGIGEKTGRVDMLLDRASKFYAQELERAMAGLTELIQPLFIVILGVFVGLLIGAIILPIYQLASKF